MIDVSIGRYWDLPWSLVESCTRCSPGCDHCWALAIEKRFKKGYEGQVFDHPERLCIPLKRRKPTVWAVWNDLFHEAVPDEFIKDAIDVMQDCPQHTFLVLTKRADRMARYFNTGDPAWPSRLPINAFPGLTICTQAEADQKIPVFLKVPGKKFLSIEPMAGPVDLSHYLWFDGTNEQWFSEWSGGFREGDPDDPKAPFSAVILGGETGPGARPMHPDWVRSVAGQCFAAGVPLFFKSWGKHIPELHDVFGDRRGVPAIAAFDRSIHHRMIDGRTHDDLPWVTPRGEVRL